MTRRLENRFLTYLGIGLFIFTVFWIGMLAYRVYLGFVG